MWYDAVQSYEWLIWSEIIFRSAQEDFDELISQISTDNIVLLCELDNTFVPAR